MRIESDGFVHRVFIDGREVSAEVSRVALDVGVSAIPTLEVAYPCFGGVLIEGMEVEVRHFCPLSEGGQDGS